MPTLEERVTELETQMRDVLRRTSPCESSRNWESIIGSFADSEGFEEAVRLGREYRESQRPVDREDRT